MHYQYQLLPTGYGGSFVAVCCHDTYPVGGEDTREAAYALALAGNIVDPANLRDLSKIAFPELQRSPSRESYQRKTAATQGELARSSQGTTAARYAGNERAMLHAARLAAQDSIRVPRKVMTTRNGRVVLQFAGSISQTSGEQQAGALRLLDTEMGSVVGNWQSRRHPLDRPGRKVERFSQKQLERAYAIALDGESILLPGDMDDPFRLTECRLDSELTEIARHTVNALQFAAIPDGWICVGDNHITWFDRQWKTQVQRPMPRNALDWAYATSASGSLVAVPTQSGSDLWLVGRDSDKPRRFSPHKGAARNNFARAFLSDCGEWLASRCGNDVVLTSLADGASRTVASAEDQVHLDESFDGFVIRSSVPIGLGFVGSELLLADGRTLQKLDFQSGDSRPFVSEHGRAGARRPIRVKALMSFEQALKAARLLPRAEQLSRFHSPAAQLQLKALKKKGWENPGLRGGPGLGLSRVGGWPDLPTRLEWPMWQCRPMAFLAQINLAEAHAAQPSLRLPTSGLLSFFLGCGEDTYEKDGDSRSRYMVDEMIGTRDGVNDGWKVIYSDPNVPLERRRWNESPLPEVFEPCAVTFKTKGLSFPDEDAVVYSLLEFGEDDRDNYNEMLSQLKPTDDRFTEQLMGYPQLIQGTPPEMMCELAFRGLDPWRYPDPASSDYRALADGASSWALLLQLTSNSSADFHWGDAGHLYFYGDRDAMERGDFSKIWVNFEN